MKKRYTTLLFALLLAALLAACASPAPEYGKVVTPTEPPATSTPEATLTPTPRPDAREMAVRLVTLVQTFRPGTTPTAEAEICSFAVDDACAFMSTWVDDRITASLEKYPTWTGSDPVIDSVELKYEGTMSNGLEYQVWAIKGHHSNYPGEKENGDLFEHYPVFVWENGQWKLFKHPYEWDAKTLYLCGQFVEHEDNSLETYQAIWDGCLTATPLPPTPQASPSATPIP